METIRGTDIAIGPITKRLRETFFNVVYGREPKYRDWLTPVYVPEHVS